MPPRQQHPRKDGQIQGNLTTTSYYGHVSLDSSLLQLAAIDTLLTTCRTIDIIPQNMPAIDGLRIRLCQLHRYLCNATARDDPEQHQRDQVASEMQSTSDQLRKLDKRSIFVKQTIIGCSRKIQKYLDDYKCSVFEGLKIQAQEFGTSDATHIPGPVASGSLILIDATGHQHEIPFECGMSLQQLNKMLALFFVGESKQARIQRQYMEQGQYDLCIDEGAQVTVLTSQGNEWPTVEPGMDIVMRVTHEKWSQVNSKIQCNYCRSSNVSMQHICMNNRFASWTVHCRKCERRHQLSISTGKLKSSRRSNIIPEDGIRHLIRNKHIRETVVSREFFRLRRRFEFFEFEERRFEEEFEEEFRQRREQRTAFLEKISQEAGHVLSPV